MDKLKAKIIQKIAEDNYTQFLPETTASQVTEETNLKFVNSTEKEWIDKALQAVQITSSNAPWSLNIGSYVKIDEKLTKSIIINKELWLQVLGSTTLGDLNNNSSTAINGTLVVNGTAKLNNSPIVSVESLNKGKANGVASLDASGKIPVSQLPNSTMGGIFFGGTFKPYTKNLSMTAVDKGVKIYPSNKFKEVYPSFVSSHTQREDDGTKYLKITTLEDLRALDGVMFKVGHEGGTGIDMNITDFVTASSLPDWDGILSSGDELYVSSGTIQLIDNTDAVKSVNSLKGNVVLDATNVNYESGKTIKAKVTEVEASIASAKTDLEKKIADTDKDILSSEGTYTAVKVNKKGKVIEGAQSIKVVTSDSNLAVDAADVVIGGLVIVTQ